MRYKKFIIKGYRGISDETIIDLSKSSLIPIIGKNESGKTTCLEAITSFDIANDDENDGNHLKNASNLYSTLEPPILISAEISIDDFSTIEAIFKSFLQEAKDSFKENTFTDLDLLDSDINGKDFHNKIYVISYRLLKKHLENNNELLIERDLRKLQYSIPILKDEISSSEENDLAQELISELPFILYFDDFRDRMPERLFITADNKSPLYSNWIKYIDELLKKTKKEYSVYDLSSKSDSIRRSILTETEKFLNKVLIEEWSKYQFEKKESIKIKIEYGIIGDDSYLQFKIVEKIYIEDEWEDRYFDLSDRSKGFYWYFNFMIKLHFNPSKRDNNDKDTIYLLDEPGSYFIHICFK